MPEKENPFNKKEDDDRNLFADESDIFGEELKKSRAEAGEKLMQEKQAEDTFSGDEDLASEEEQAANPVRRFLLIAASIVAGIALGVGGYFFFTAGSKHAPVEKQIARTLPEPASIPMPPAVPSEKPKVIPEIPVKSEPQKPETAQAKEVKPQETLPTPEAKKESVQKTEAGKPNKETAPVAAASGAKQPATAEQSAKKETRAAGNGKRPYYVQAGLFENEANAKVMANKLKKKGYASSVKKIKGKDNKAVFRVTAGTYASFKKALDVAEILNKQGVKAIVHKQ